MLENALLHIEFFAVFGWLNTFCNTGKIIFFALFPSFAWGWIHNIQRKWRQEKRTLLFVAIESIAFESFLIIYIYWHISFEHSMSLRSILLILVRCCFSAIVILEYYIFYVDGFSSKDTLNCDVQSHFTPSKQKEDVGWASIHIYSNEISILIYTKCFIQFLCQFVLKMLSYFRRILFYSFSLRRMFEHATEDKKKKISFCRCIKPCLLKFMIMRTKMITF